MSFPIETLPRCQVSETAKPYTTVLAIRVTVKCLQPAEDYLQNQIRADILLAVITENEEPAKKSL